MRLERLLDMLNGTKEDPFILFAIAKEYENKGEDNISLDYYSKLIANHPNYVGTYYHLGKLYERTDNMKEAINTYTNGMLVAKNNKDQHSYNELAAAKFNLTDE